MKSKIVITTVMNVLREN